MEKVKGLMWMEKTKTLASSNVKKKHLADNISGISLIDSSSVCYDWQRTERDINQCFWRHNLIMI